MAERNAAVGYVAIKKETTKGVAVTPTVYVPYYKQDMATNFNVISDEPVVGNKFKRFQTLKGIRSHKGSITIMAEANSIGYFLDMLATKASTSGSDPYTHTFSASNATNPNSYTMDISFGSQVVRYFGVEASKMTFGFDGEKMIVTIDLSALGSFHGREILSISTTTINFTADGYDPSATTGLVASDIIYVVDPEGSIAQLSTTVASITDLDTIVAGATAAAFAAGDYVVLRAATPSYTLLQPFLWGRTQFCFGATASAALSATQTRLEPGTEISITHEFDDDEGAKRSGQFDPAALVRTVYDAGFEFKKYFDTTEEIKKWNAQTKFALVMRAYTGATNQYELRVTLNNLRTSELNIPTESKATILHEISVSPNFDTSDSQGFDVKALNGVSTI